MRDRYSYEQDSFANPFIGIIRWTGLLMPIPVSVYTVSAAIGASPKSPLFSIEVAVILSFLFFALCAWQFLTRNYSQNATITRVVAYQMISGLYFVLVSGFNSPLIFCWLLLIIISEVFFGKKGLLLSIFTLLGFASISFALGEHTDRYVFNAVSIIFYVIVCSVFTVLLRSATRKEHLELIKARESNAVDHGQLQTVLNTISVGILSTDPGGTIHTYNAAFLSLLDSNENLVGKNANDSLKIYSTKNEPIELMSLVKKSYMTRRDDIILKYEDGDEIRLGITINPIRASHNKLGGYIFIVEDVTKEKSLEEERDEFISVISHELRTPITICEGSISNAQLLLEKGADPTVLKQPFNEAHEQVVYLANMVNDLGTLSRAERGVGDNLEEIDVNKLAGDLYAKYSPRAEQKGLHLNLDVSGGVGKVLTSQLYLEEILQNFITNSIKYTPAGKITLIIRRTKNGVLFAVKDTGIGVSKSDQKRIFEKFYRSEDYRTRETSGTGLGLYVVQKLAHKLGVVVEVESRLNHGSTFSFTLLGKR